VNRQGAKAAKGFFGWASGGVVVAGVGLVMFSACGGRESTSQTTPGNGNGGGGGAAVGDAAAGAAGGVLTDEMTACAGRDCTLLRVKCPMCEATSINEFTAVNSRYEEAFLNQNGGSIEACGPCASPAPDVLSAQANFIGLCESGRCRAVDLRSSRFSECKANTDCELQYGTACCGGCGNRDLIALNPAANLHHEVCGDIEPPCVPPDPQCIAQRTGSPIAMCSPTTGHCVIAVEHLL
jgi:hypothetical protein